MSTIELNKKTFSGDNVKKRSQQDIDIAFCSEASLSYFKWP